MKSGVQSLVDHPIILWGGILAAVVSFIVGTVNLYLYLEDQKELVSSLNESFLEHTQKIETLLIKIKSEQSGQTTHLTDIHALIREHLQEAEAEFHELQEDINEMSIDLQYKLGEHAGSHEVH